MDSTVQGWARPIGRAAGVTGAAWAVGIAIAAMAGIVVSVIIGGLLIGLAHAYVLDRRFRRSSLWTLSYAAAWGVALWVGYWRAFILPDVMAIAVVGGASTGAIEAIASRGRVRWGAALVPGMVVIAIAGCWLGTTAGSFAYDKGAADVVAYGIAGLVCGAIVGALSWLLRSNLPSRTESLVAAPTY